MMILFEDLRQALRQICQAMGLSGTSATVVPLVVLGVALNIAALNAMESIWNHRHPGQNRPTALQSATRTELKVMRAVVVSTLKKISDGQRRWCLAQQWIRDRKTEISGYDIEVSFVWTSPSKSDVCDMTISRSPVRKGAIAFVQC